MKNLEHLGQDIKLKKEGVTPGVFDYFLCDILESIRLEINELKVRKAERV